MVGVKGQGRQGTRGTPVGRFTPAGNAGSSCPLISDPGLTTELAEDRQRSLLHTNENLRSRSFSLAGKEWAKIANLFFFLDSIHTTQSERDPMDSRGNGISPANRRQLFYTRFHRFPSLITTISGTGFSEHTTTFHLFLSFLTKKKRLEKEESFFPLADECQYKTRAPRFAHCGGPPFGRQWGEGPAAPRARVWALEISHPRSSRQSSHDRYRIWGFGHQSDQTRTTQNVKNSFISCIIWPQTMNMQ